MSVSPDTEAMTMRKPGDRPPASSQPDIPDFISDNLRRLFGAVEAEPLPDRFIDLLRKLAEADEDGK